MPSRSSKLFLSTEILVSNRWHRYCRDEFRQTDGSVGEYFHLDMAGACGIIPLFEDGSTVLLEVYRYLLDATLWEFPIGGMAAGEDPLAVARKELREEAGLLAEDWQRLGTVAPYKGVSTEIDHFFLARDLRWTDQELEPSEQIEVHRMPLAEARRRLLEQPLLDGQSVAGLALLDRWQRTGEAAG
jgi:8-oxo-dGTP pyrophosphatase MutT (NUDIX family)